jgi:hypothetical protein
MSGWAGAENMMPFKIAPDQERASG